MNMNQIPFSYLETHRVVHQRGNLVHQSSEGAGWPSLFASVQTEACYEGFFPAIKDHLVVIPLKQSVRFSRRIGGELQERILPPGSTTITPGGADFSVRTESDGGAYDTIHFYIRHETLEEIHVEMFETTEGFTLPPFIGVMDMMIQSVAFEIRRMLASPAPSNRFYAETLSRMLASCLVRNHISGQRPHIKSKGKLSSLQLRRAIEYIEEYLADNLNLSRIAKAAGINTGLLAREFRNAMELTPYEYVMRARVDRAKHLLVSTDLPLADIALQCGFSHQQHMTRIIHRTVGITPGAIRRAR
jgi:AraC family transcriptional regulator